MSTWHISNYVTILRIMARLKDLLEKYNVIGSDGVIAETDQISEIEDTALRTNQIASLFP